MRFPLVLGLILFATIWAARADDDPPQDPPPTKGASEASPSDLRSFLPRMMHAMRKLGNWDEQSKLVIQAAEKVYERNEWTEEPHQFSLDVFRAVQTKPPWAFQERFDTLIGMVSDRYMLDEDQEQGVREMLIQTSSDVLRRHAPEIMKYMTDIVETRAAGDPFTAEKVAEWAKLAGPVMEDAQKVFLQKSEELMQKLDPEQQDLLKRDLWAVQDRFDAISDMRERWVRGEWKATDWGIEDDPIQLAGERKLAEQHANGDGEAKSTDAAKGDEAVREMIRKRIAERAKQKESGDEAESSANSTKAAGGKGDTAEQSDAARGDGKSKPALRAKPKTAPTDEWAKYVIDFIAKFKLNDDQEQKAWAVYQEASERRDAIKSRIAERAKNEDQRKAAEEKQKSSFDRLFEQMKRRLNQLPTRAQRAAAEKVEREKTPTTKMSVNPTTDVGP